MECVVRFVQTHESFRQAELVALAELAQVKLEILQYDANSPFCVIRVPDAAAAQALCRRSVLIKRIYELWGSGETLEALHADVRRRTAGQWARYTNVSFRFTFDLYQGTRPPATQVAQVESFAYLGFEGPIRMRDAEEHFCICEAFAPKAPEPYQLYFGRVLAAGARDAITRYSLKSRKYISTTSMDAELALIMANLALAAPGRIFYDPFVGTGSLTLGCAHFGAYVLGSDIDGRAIRGKDGLSVRSSFSQYDLARRDLGSFVADLTHSPARHIPGGWLHGIVCDPPYGIREGLKVLGRRDGTGKEVIMVNGEALHLSDRYVPPKKPYSFEAMLDDILQFAADMLVVEGRLSLWMPTANDEEQLLSIPTHHELELLSCCIQPFNKWSRRLLTYRRRSSSEVSPRPSDQDEVSVHSKPATQPAARADDLNHFRKRGFRKSTQHSRDTDGTAKSEERSDLATS